MRFLKTLLLVYFGAAAGILAAIFTSLFTERGPILAAIHVCFLVPLTIGLPCVFGSTIFVWAGGRK